MRCVWVAVDVADAVDAADVVDSAGAVEVAVAVATAVDLVPVSFLAEVSGWRVAPVDLQPCSVYSQTCVEACRGFCV